MKVRQIKGRNYLFSHENIKEWDLHLHLIMGERFNFLIDTGLGSQSVEPIKAHLSGSKKQLIIINTHYHWDHVWGNGAFENPVIVSHSLCRKVLEDKWEDMIAKSSRYLYGEVKKVLPNLLFEGQLWFPEDRVRVFYTPGHTADSISVLDEREGILNIGDNIGDTPEEILPGLECEKELYIETLNLYRSLDFDTCLSGHNQVMGREFIDRILKAM